MGKTRAELRAYVQNFTGRTDAASAALINELIDDTIAFRIARPYEWSELYAVEDDLTVAVGAYQVALPTNFLRTHRKGLRLYNGSSYDWLKWVDYRIFRRRWPDIENDATNEPHSWTIINKQLWLYPRTDTAIADDGTYILKLEYWKRPGALADEATPDDAVSPIENIDDVIQDFVIADIFNKLEEYERGAVYEVRAVARLQEAALALSPGGVGSVASYDDFTTD